MKCFYHYDEEQKRRYVQTYGFETELDYHSAIHLGGYNKKFKAIAVNLGHTNSKMFDSVWRQKCPTCYGEGKKAEIYADLDGEALPTLITCPACEGTGYIEPYDLMIIFCRRKDHKWNVSLYSTKEHVDCGAIAKTFGGEGHKGAAGFQCEELPFEY